MRPPWTPGLCAHCLEPLEPACVGTRHTAFCNGFCQKRAEDVRYVRLAIRDGRIPANHAAGDDGMTAEIIFTNKIVFFDLDLAYIREKLPQRLREQVLAANGGVCVLCGERRAAEVDHIAGGSQEPKNLQGLCKQCHEYKPRGEIPEDLTRGGLDTVDDTPSNAILSSAWHAALFSFETYEPLDPSLDWSDLRSTAEEMSHTRFGSLTLGLLDDAITAPAHDPGWASTWRAYRSETLDWAKAELAKRGNGD